MTTTAITHTVSSPRQSIRREATRTRLLDAASSIFAAHGYAGATIDEIAVAARLSKGAVYFHFASKEDVFLEVLWSRLRGEEQRLRHAVQGAASRPLEYLLRQVVSYLGLDARSASWPPLMVEFWSHAGRNPRILEALATVSHFRRRALEAVLAAAADAGVIHPALRLEHCADMLLTLGDGLVAQSGSGQERPPTEALVSMIAYVLGVSDAEPAPNEDRSTAAMSQRRH
ncbi:MAG: TetR/AcrR family transcriptional regulator [Dehalococcoidia bacterium]